MTVFIYILCISVTCDILCLESYRITKKPTHKKKLPSKKTVEYEDNLEELIETERSYTEKEVNKIENNGPVHLINYKSINQRKTKEHHNYFFTVTLPVLGGLLIGFFCLCYVTRPSGSLCRLFDEEEIPPCAETCTGLCHLDPKATLTNYDNESTASRSIEEIHQSDNSKLFFEKKNSLSQKPNNEEKSQKPNEEKNIKDIDKQNIYITKAEGDERKNYNFKPESVIEETNIKITKPKMQLKREQAIPPTAKKQLHKQPSKTNLKINSKDKLYMQANTGKPITRDGIKLNTKNKLIRAKSGNLHKPIEKRKKTNYVPKVK